MNKTELVGFVSEKTELTKVAAAGALEAVIEAIMGSLKAGKPVAIPGFGTFTVKECAAREGRNPSTGEKIYIKASKRAGFKPAQALKDAIATKDGA
ncbi:MAG TPA: HU family DNA-binding protein [Gammaproteobacteria bacterium]|jgi:DNA-binding protein HU-beta|nr:HU family DNA-binding protein [Gammaproteobacteria bacterium]